MRYRNGIHILPILKQKHIIFPISLFLPFFCHHLGSFSLGWVFKICSCVAVFLVFEGVSKKEKQVLQCFTQFLPEIQNFLPSNTPDGDWAKDNSYLWNIASCSHRSVCCRVGEENSMSLLCPDGTPTWVGKETLGNVWVCQLVKGAGRHTMNETNLAMTLQSPAWMENGSSTQDRSVWKVPALGNRTAGSWIMNPNAGTLRMRLCPL